MPHEQNGLKKMSGIGVVAAFGLITMSSSITSQSLTTMDMKYGYYYEANNYLLTDNTICSSSELSKRAVGDIILNEKKMDFVSQRKKINVNLQVMKISKYVSNFDFEEEFEEI